MSDKSVIVEFEKFGETITGVKLRFGEGIVISEKENKVILTVPQAKTLANAIRAKLGA
jgi:hypothetical protein